MEVGRPDQLIGDKFVIIRMRHFFFQHIVVRKDLFILYFGDEKSQK